MRTFRQNCRTVVFEFCTEAIIFSVCGKDVMATSENFAGNIIASLASLPDFLRRPILKKRMQEFFSLSEEEKHEIIANALEAGPYVEFARFEKLFKTWLEILATLPVEQREELVAAYVIEAGRHPQRLIAFNLDAIFGIFLELNKEQQDAIATSVKRISVRLGQREARVIKLAVPDSAKRHLGMSL